MAKSKKSIRSHLIQARVTDQEHELIILQKKNVMACCELSYADFFVLLAKFCNDKENAKIVRAFAAENVV